MMLYRALYCFIIGWGRSQVSGVRLVTNPYDTRAHRRVVGATARLQTMNVQALHTKL